MSKIREYEDRHPGLGLQGFKCGNCYKTRRIVVRVADAEDAIWGSDGRTWICLTCLQAAMEDTDGTQDEN